MYRLPTPARLCWARLADRSVGLAGEGAERLGEVPVRAEQVGAGWPITRVSSTVDSSSSTGSR
ncbi:hypothetical protein TH66_08005 [Carbonactinospora thermoautotrophica]|uniref:Uncharacterized protein n=1 Tax=Carbonactinospora thermoautotrophica TaxID=1469144 RepID=A0A132NME5_9ACTN|nr:hypothetical protein TH66_08005 [Carbonactinospora thermoautotrophica]KWX10952.1 hypothetical protein TR74_00605 [Carbonactinospora thermoautotrophica]